MGCIKREQFASAPKRKTEKVAVPEYGDDAYVNVVELGADQLQQLRADHNPPKDDSFFDFEYELLSSVLVDDDGNKLYADGHDVKANVTWSLALLQRLVKEALKVSGLDVEKNV